MRITKDDVNSLRLLIKNKGICFGTQDKVINCESCALYDYCTNIYNEDIKIVEDIHHHRYLLAVDIVKDMFTESELFDLLL